MCQAEINFGAAVRLTGRRTQTYRYEGTLPSLQQKWYVIICVIGRYVARVKIILIGERKLPDPRKPTHTYRRSGACGIYAGR